MPRKEKMGRPRAKGKTAKGNARETERREEARKEANLQRADVSSAEESTGPPSAPKMLSKRVAASPRPWSKGAISRRR